MGVWLAPKAYLYIYETSVTLSQYLQMKRQLKIWHCLQQIHSVNNALESSAYSQ